MSLVAASLAAQAYDYPYLAFQTADGSVKTVSVESLSISFSDGKLVVTNGDGTSTFTLTDLTKMYFSTENTSTGIEKTEGQETEQVSEVYDLQGRKIPVSDMRHGIYLIKTKKGTQKVYVK